MKLSELPRIAQIVKGLKIIMKYCPNDFPSAEHDEIWAGDEKCHPKKIDPKDKKRLKLCGFTWDKDVERWQRFV